MGFLARLLTIFKPRSSATVSRFMRGLAVDAPPASSHPALVGAIRLLTSSVASLPWVVYMRTDTGRVRAEWLPAYQLLKSRPNSAQTTFDFFEYIMQSLLLRGEAFVFVRKRIRQDRGRVFVDPVALIPVDPDRVEVKITEDYEKKFTIDGVEYSSKEIMHIIANSADGIRGRSIVQAIATSIELGVAGRHFNRAFLRNYAVPVVAIEVPTQLKSAEEVDRIREAFLANYSGDQIHSVAVLHSGVQLKPLSLRPEDAQLIDALKLSDTDIAKALGIPPHMLGLEGKGGYNSIEHQAIEFVQYSLRPWLVRIEQSLTASLFQPDEPFYVEAQVDGLLRGDVLSRYKVYQIAITHGIMSRNEVRRLENLPPYDGGDDMLTPVNLSTKREEDYAD